MGLSSAKLMHRILKALNVTLDQVQYGQTQLLFCTGRMEVLDNLINFCWQSKQTSIMDVPSGEYPADMASRGLLFKDLINYDLGWNNGPHWLHSHLTIYPEQPLHNKILS